MNAFVRDGGAGFDPAVVPDDRRGIADSIVQRMERHGGTVEIRSHPGAGTEVHLHLPRRVLAKAMPAPSAAVPVASPAPSTPGGAASGPVPGLTPP
ncbi:MAG: ATP-binding protein [Chloroflexi bacterium]|nr:ATP-binding protein [Chloroflexota bacterium]